MYNDTGKFLEDRDIFEALEIVDEDVRYPDILKELQGDRVPEPGLYGVVGDDPALLPHDSEVHGHGDGEPENIVNVERFNKDIIFYFEATIVFPYLGL